MRCGAIPGADGAGLTLLEDDQANTIVATAAFVSEIDDIQYGIGQGTVHHCCSRGSDSDVGLPGQRPAVAGVRWHGRPAGVCTACCRYRWSSPTGWSGR